MLIHVSRHWAGSAVLNKPDKSGNDRKNVNIKGEGKNIFSVTYAHE
jgi:hypothetical protein